MKKFLALMLSVMMLFTVCNAEQLTEDTTEEAQQAEVIESLVDFDIVLDNIFEGYTLDKYVVDSVLYFTISSNDDDPTANFYYGAVAHADEFDSDENPAYTLDVASLTDDQIAQMQEYFGAGYDEPKFSFSKTSHGTDVIIVEETDCETLWCDVYTIYEGYIYNVGAVVSGELTQDVIDGCVTVMGDLWVVNA